MHKQCNNILLLGLNVAECTILNGFLMRNKHQYGILQLIKFDIHHPKDPDMIIFDTEDRASIEAWTTVCEYYPDVPTLTVVGRDYQGRHYLNMIQRPLHFANMLQWLQRIVANKIESDVYKKARVLVVDDSLSIRTDMRLKLELYKLDIDFAEDGESALMAVKNQKYDLVFLDIMMPGIDGYQTSQLIKTHYKNMAIVMLTSKSSYFSKMRGKISGCDSYMVKPATKKDLYHILNTYLPRVIKESNNMNNSNVNNKKDIDNYFFGAEEKTV
ncbi:MAG: response regulator [Mariprofundales bacterium]